MSTAPAKTDNVSKLSAYLQSDPGRRKLQEYAPEDVSESEVKRLGLHLMRNSTDGLEECTPESLVDCILQAYHLGLDLTTDEAYLIPYGGEAQMRAGYQGLVKLAKQSSAVAHLFADLVRDGDDFTYRRTLEGVEFAHEPDHFGDGELVGAYCVIKYTSGEADVERMSKSQIDDVRKKADQDSFAWRDFYGEMAKKAVTRRALKWVDLSPEAREVIDNARQDFEMGDEQLESEKVTDIDSLASDLSGGGGSDEPKSLEPAENGAAGTSESVAGEGGRSPDPPSTSSGSQATEPGDETVSSLRRSVSQLASNAEGVDKPDVEDFKEALRRDGIWDDRKELAAVRQDLQSNDDRWGDVMYPLIELAGGGGDQEADEPAEGDAQPAGETGAIDWLADQSTGAEKVVSRLRKHCDDDSEVYAVLLHIAKELDLDPDAPIQRLADADLDGFRQQRMTSPRKVNGLVNDATDDIPY